MQECQSTSPVHHSSPVIVGIVYQNKPRVDSSTRQCLSAILIWFVDAQILNCVLIWILCLWTANASAKYMYFSHN